jgi:hypothetical protein
MTKGEQTRLAAWRLKLLRQALDYGLFASVHQVAVAPSSVHCGEHLVGGLGNPVRAGLHTPHAVQTL